MKPDPITIEIIAGRLGEIAAAMAHALYHSGFSPILRESQDGTAGLADARGNVLVIGGGIQYHVLAYSRAVASVLERFSPGNIAPGDSFIVNDPYLAGNPHVPDMVALTPAFRDGRIVAFGVSVAHKADLGGLVPGSSGAGAREIYHDGLLLPPVRYQRADGIDSTVEDIIRNNSRIPEIVIGDIRGQVGCTRLGATRLERLCDEYGADTVGATMDELLRLSALRLRAELAGWRDGAAEAHGLLDHDGVDRDRPLTIRVRASKHGDRLTLDFAGSSPQAQGPVNAGATTVRAACLMAVVAAADPALPINSGLLDAIDFRLPEGTLINPRHPATVNHYFPTIHLAYNCVLAALGELNPARAVAPSGLGNGAIAIGYPQSRAGRPDVHYELLVSSLGGTSNHDGASIVMPMNHYTPSTPIEVLETEYPVRVRRFDVRPDSAGAGRWRGGLGFVREYEMLGDCTLTVRSANHRYGAWGVAGGRAPALPRIAIDPGGGKAEELGPLATRRLARGNLLRIDASGGGGYGPAHERAPEQVLDDVRNGYVSIEGAQRDYAVVIEPRSMTVDDAATIALRRARG